MTIHLHLGADNMLDSADIYKYVDENSEQNAKFALYIDKLCEYLNHIVTGNSDLRFGDVEYARLGGWLTGFEAAMSYNVVTTPNNITVKTKRHTVILDKPRKETLYGKALQSRSVQ